MTLPNSNFLKEIDTLNKGLEQKKSNPVSNASEPFYPTPTGKAIPTKLQQSMALPFVNTPSTNVKSLLGSPMTSDQLLNQTVSAPIGEKADGTPIYGNVPKNESYSYNAIAKKETQNIADYKYSQLSPLEKIKAQNAEFRPLTSQETKNASNNLSLAERLKEFLGIGQSDITTPNGGVATFTNTGKFMEYNDSYGNHLNSDVQTLRTNIDSFAMAILKPAEEIGSGTFSIANILKNRNDPEQYQKVKQKLDEFNLVWDESIAQGPTGGLLGNLATFAIPGESWYGFIAPSVSMFQGIKDGNNNEFVGGLTQIALMGVGGKMIGGMAESGGSKIAGVLEKGASKIVPDALKSKAGQAFLQLTKDGFKFASRESAMGAAFSVSSLIEQSKGDITTQQLLKAIKDGAMAGLVIGSITHGVIKGVDVATKKVIDIRNKQKESTIIVPKTNPIIKPLTNKPLEVKTEIIPNLKLNVDIKKSNNKNATQQYDAKNDSSIIKIPKNAPYETQVHEVAHALDRQNPELRTILGDEIKSITGKEVITNEDFSGAFKEVAGNKTLQENNPKINKIIEETIKPELSKYSEIKPTETPVVKTTKLGEKPVETKHIEKPTNPLIQEASKYKSADGYSSTEEILNYRKFNLNEDNLQRNLSELSKDNIPLNKDGTLTLYRGQDKKFGNNEVFKELSQWTTNPKLAKRINSNVYEIKVNPKDVVITNKMGDGITFQNLTKLVRQENGIYGIEPKIHTLDYWHSFIDSITCK